MTHQPSKKLKSRDGVQLFYLPKARTEAKFLYQEVFVDKVYARFGIEIHDGDCLLDVGANIGMFTAFAMRQCKNLKVFAFEPVPPIYEVLKANVDLANAGNDHEIHVLNYGLSDEDAECEITWFPRTPANSTLFPEQKENQSKVSVDAFSIRDVWVYDKVAFFVLLLLFPFRRRLIQKRIQSLYRDAQRFSCKVKRLDTVIDEYSLESIDLLKIDTEGSEIDVLRGISDDHWSRIKQLVVEIHTPNLPHVPQLKQDLVERGFRVLGMTSMGYDRLLPNSDLPLNLYAAR